MTEEAYFKSSKEIHPEVKNVIKQTMTSHYMIWQSNYLSVWAYNSTKEIPGWSKVNSFPFNDNIHPHRNS